MQTWGWLHDLSQTFMQDISTFGQTNGQTDGLTDNAFFLKFKVSLSGGRERKNMYSLHGWLDKRHIDSQGSFGGGGSCGGRDRWAASE